MIAPVSGHTSIASLQLAAKPAKAAAAAQPAATPAVDSPVNENNEPASEELKEAPSQKATEALKALANRGSDQLPVTTATPNTNAQVGKTAYQTLVK